MRLVKVLVDGVDVGDRRPVDPGKVSAITESIKAIGLQTPISVWSPDDYTCVLVAGRHRLEAARRLGWDLIPAVCVLMDEIDRELWEIDENLMRANLTPLEEAQALARRKELFKARQSAEVQPVESRREDGKGHRTKGFAADTQEKTGKPKSTINQAISRAVIPDDVMEMIWGTTLDKGIYLDALKKLEPEEMRERVRADQEKHRTATEAINQGAFGDEDAQWSAFTAALRESRNAPPDINRLVKQLSSELYNYLAEDKKLDRQLTELVAFVDDISEVERINLVDGLQEMARKATGWAERFSGAEAKMKDVSRRALGQRPGDVRFTLRTGNKCGDNSRKTNGTAHTAKA